MLAQHSINTVPDSQTVFERLNVDVRAIRTKSVGDNQVHHLDQRRVLLVPGLYHAAFTHSAASFSDIHLRLGKLRNQSFHGLIRGTIETIYGGFDLRFTGHLVNHRSHLKQAVQCIGGIDVARIL